MSYCCVTEGKFHLSWTIHIYCVWQDFVRVIEKNDCMLCVNSIVNTTDYNVKYTFKILVLSHSILGTVKEVEAFGGSMTIFIRKVGLFYASFYT